MKNENFRTSDFYLAAYCLAKDARLLGVDKSNPQRAVFIFDYISSQNIFSEDFLFGEAQVNAREFVAAIRTLKQILYG